MVKTIFFIILLLGVPAIATAQVIINEIAWMGSEVEGINAKQEWRYEWIEIFNAGEDAISLKGWRIELYSGETLEFTIVLYKSVEANGYFLVGASDKISGVDINYATLAGKFKNPGQRVVLRDAVGDVVEEIDASNGWFAGDKDSKLTMERRFPGRASEDPENWGSSQNTGGTLRAENSIFGKERFLALGQGSSTDALIIKKDQPWSSLVSILSNTVFIRAFLAALVFAILLVGLRRYLASQDEDSFGALKD